MSTTADRSLQYEARPQGLAGGRRTLAGVALSAANLMVVLDMTIANVSIPHISGSLGISPSQGAWVITSYAVAEAVSVPLTGWFAQRFGAVRVFVFGVVGFGLFSLLCGLSLSLGMLAACRVGQGLCGGPVMPLTQTLLLRIFPPEKGTQALNLWATTSLVGPVLGPILGGMISDNVSWHWIFLINIPAVAFCVFTVRSLMADAPAAKVELPIDRIGLLLLIIWISALQIMLDIGREHDWFSNGVIVALATIAAIGFVAFVIWELTEEHPIVDLKIFRHGRYTAGVFTLALGVAAWFAGIVVIPQWMQLSLGYTATQAGWAMAVSGIAGLMVSRLPPLLVARIDPRVALSAGLTWVGGATLLRTQWNSAADFWTLATPQFVMGLGLPFFFVTVTMMSLGAVPQREVASAAGLQNFVRIIAMALSTSVVMTYWDEQSRVAGSELVGNLHPDATTAALMQHGFSLDQIRLIIAQLVEKEALTLATDKVFLLASILLWIVAAMIWIVPKPRRK